MAVHWKAHMTEDSDDGEDSDGGVHSEDSEWYEEWVEYMQQCDGAMLLAVFKSAAAKVTQRKHKRDLTVWLEDYTCAD